MIIKFLLKLLPALSPIFLYILYEILNYILYKRLDNRQNNIKNLNIKDADIIDADIDDYKESDIDNHINNKDKNLNHYVRSRLSLSNNLFLIAVILSFTLMIISFLFLAVK